VERKDELDRKADRLCTLAHSLGASCTAAASAGLVAFIAAASVSRISQEVSDWVRFFVALLMAALIVGLFSVNYRRTARFARSFADLLLENSLRHRKDAKGSAFAAYVRSQEELWPLRKGSSDNEVATEAGSPEA